ncbi:MULTISPECIES: NPCBM/NEW2 domain-containing protein [unclassified Saccharicrinis]|uniref:NPCBM/NEW2 domain-containing protein n=1 Tax=unclassified Saccharicrinis TaxID=2646859 RepID=UPI003D328F84
MKKIFLILIIAFITGLSFTQAQNCGDIINDTFDNDGTLPTQWTEYNTSGQVTVSGAEMVFDYTSAKPSAYRTFNAVNGKCYYSFKIKSQRNWFKAKMNLEAGNGDLITSILFGNDGKKDILYATDLDASNNPTSYVGALDASFSSNTEYLVLLIVDTENKTFDFYIDGELKVSGVAFLENATGFGKIDIQQISMYGGSGKVYFDNVQITQDNVIRVNLEAAIANAREHLDEINIGTGNGEYSQGVVDVFQSKIDEASSVYANCEASQDEVDSAVVFLETAWSSFDDSRNWGMQDISITIDPTNVLCERNPIWFGGNNTYNGSGQGLWDSSNERCHYNVIDLANYTGAPGYRFPGGTMANLYRWKRAIGPVDQRIDNLNSHGSAGPLSNEFGPDEFGHMLENTHLNKGVIVVAFNWETVQDAADYVEYMNAEVGENPNGGTDWAQVRADNGHPEPYNVKYWEIGNELNGTWELSVCNYPASGDANRGGDEILNGKVGVYVHGDPRSFTNQRAAKQTSWVQSVCVVDGSANQEFYTKFCPVDLSKSFTLTINGVTWNRVADLSSSGSNDLHYTVDAETGKISFGDGTNGSVPSGGYNVMLNYSTDELDGFPEYYEAMKAVDPSIEVISCWEEEEFYREMAEINAPFDGVTKHYYPSGTVEAGDEYKMVMKKSVSYKSKIQSHLNHLSDHSNSSLSGKNVQQHLTEFFGGKTIGVVTQLCVMWHDIINSYSDDMGNMMAHSYFKNDNTPMVNTGGNFVSAKGLPYHIFTHLHQDKFVEAEYQGGSYTYSNTSIQNSYPTASINEEGNVLTLVVPNTLDEDELRASINISNYGFGFSEVIGKKWVATAYDIYTENTSASPYNVSVEGPFDIELGQSLTDTVQPFSVAIYQWIVEERDFLSDLSEVVDGEDINKDEGFGSEGNMTVNGITYEKGIGVEAGTSVTYNLNGNYLTFLTEFGLDDSYTGGEFNMAVYVDDELAYQSADINSNSPTPVLNIDVSDADKLRIETYSTLSSDGEEFIIFGNARLINGDEDNSIGSGLNVSHNIQVAPNPFDSNMKIELPKIESGKVILLDMAGNIQYSAVFNESDQIYVDHISVPAGTYALLVYADGVIYSTKVVKR